MQLSLDSEAEIRTWEREWKLTIVDNPIALKALKKLEAAGCNAKTLIWVLELLRIYSSKETTKIVKGVMKNGARRTRDLASALRRNEKALQRLDFRTSIARPMSKELLGIADALEFFSKYTRFVWSTGVYGRQLGKFLYPLVYAAELIERRTKAPHYRELLDLLNAVRSRSEISEGAVGKKIRSFKERNRDFRISQMQGDKLAPSIRTCIAEDKSFRAFLTQHPSAEK